MKGDVSPADCVMMVKRALRAEHQPSSAVAQFIRFANNSSESRDGGGGGLSALRRGCMAMQHIFHYMR